jgi:hypothetical protein
MKSTKQRKRNAMVLVMRFLVDHGYMSSFQALSKESNLSLEKVDCADNIDLISILQVRMCSLNVCHGLI